MYAFALCNILGNLWIAYMKQIQQTHGGLKDMNKDWKPAVGESKAVIPSEYAMQGNTTDTEVLLWSVSGQRHKAYDSICWHLSSQE